MWVPLVLILGSMLFNIFINHLDGGIKYSLMKFDNDTKPSGEMNTSEERDALQDDLGRLEEWANKNHTKFSKDKCKI